MSVFNIGVVTAISTVANGYMAKKAGDRAEDQNNKALALGDRELAFEEERWAEEQARYEEWKAIYGPIEENLGEFYSNLTPETYTAAGLEFNQVELDKANTQALETFAQRGLSSSGLTASTEQQSSRTAAENKAKIRFEAPFKVAKEKSDFLSQGNGGPQYGPTGANLSIAMGNQTDRATAQTDRAYANANSLWGSTGSLLSTGLNSVMKGYQAPKVPGANTGTAAMDIGFNPTASDFNIGIN